MIGIISAMSIEIEKLKNNMSDIKSEVISSVEYFKGKINGKNCVLAVSGVGKVNAAVSAQTMILKYAPGIIINLGVAGGLLSTMKVGDVIVATDAVQCDVDTSAVGDPIGMISTINIINIPCDKFIAEKVKNICEKNVFFGTIASGDKFIVNKEDLLTISNEFNAIACDMETASIAHVCYLNKIKFSSIRVISDNVNEDSSNFNYESFKFLAADKCCQIVNKIILKI